MAGIGYNNAPNYKAYPGSFIGRQIGFYEIKHADLNVFQDNSHRRLDTERFRLAIQTIQLQAEILFIGTPYVSDNWSRFVVGLAVDTANTNAPVFSGDNGMAMTLQDLLRNVPSLNDNGNDAIVTRYYLFGGNQDGFMKNESDFLSAITANTTTSYTGFASGSVEQNELIEMAPELLGYDDVA